MKRPSIPMALAAGLCLCSSLATADPPSADEQASRMLAATGGRAAWAAASNTVNDSQQNRAGEPAVVRAVITMDFERPRFRIETTGPELHLIRVIDGERNWRKTREGRIEPVPEQVIADDLKWYAGHVYRTIHCIARGEPYAFGAHADDVGSLCGPWEFEAGGIRHPLWVSSADGTWRAMITSLAVNVPLDDSLFARPASRSGQ